MRWALPLRWPPLSPWQQKYSQTMWRLCWWVQTSLVCDRHVVWPLESGADKKSIIVRVVFPPFLPAPWKIINNLWFTVCRNYLILLLLCTVNTNAYFILLLFSLFRVVWRFSQDSGSSWGLQLEGGSISLSDMKSLFCFSDVSCWLWFLSTYTSCQPSVIVCDFSILIVRFESFLNIWTLNGFLCFCPLRVRSLEGFVLPTSHQSESRPHLLRHIHS